MNEESNKKDNEDSNNKDNEDSNKKDKEERRRRKEERRRRKYSQMINYPNMNVEIQLAAETDAELFNNIFDENQVICQNNVKRYVYCSTIFILYAAIGFMYYTYIY